jgi:hypothetical protein
MVRENSIHVLARWIGLTRDDYFVTTRKGSTSQDIGVSRSAALGRIDAIPNLVRFVEGRISGVEPRHDETVTVVRSATRSKTRRGRIDEVEQIVIDHYLQGFPAALLSPTERRSLAWCLSRISGLRVFVSTGPVGARRPRVGDRAPPSKRSEALASSKLGIRLGRHPQSAARWPVDLVEVAETASFKRDHVSDLPSGRPQIDQPPPRGLTGLLDLRRFLEFTGPRSGSYNAQVFRFLALMRIGSCLNNSLMGATSTLPTSALRTRGVFVVLLDDSKLSRAGEGAVRGGQDHVMQGLGRSRPVPLEAAFNGRGPG